MSDALVDYFVELRPPKNNTWIIAHHARFDSDKERKKYIQEHLKDGWEVVRTGDLARIIDD